MTTQSALPKPVPPAVSWREYGCRINHHPPHRLLDWYDHAGFLYPAKRDRLAPVLTAAVQAWWATLALGDTVRRTCTYDHHGRWASMDQWRSAAGTWTVQHLVSNGGGVGSRATILAGLRYGLDDPDARAWNCWFRMDNPMPRRVLATSIGPVGPANSSLTRHELLALPLTPTTTPAPGATADAAAGLAVREPGVRELGAAEVAGSGVLDLIRDARGTVFVTAQDLDGPDPLLTGLDSIYRAAGLTRRRHILTTTTPTGAAGAALAGTALIHRGPIGTNFTFLENRCDLILAPGLDARTGRVAALALAEAAAAFYVGDSPPPFIPIVTDPDTAHILLTAGATPIRPYAHVTWLRAGLPALHDHFESCFARLAARR